MDESQEEDGSLLAEVHSQSVGGFSAESVNSDAPVRLNKYLWLGEYFEKRTEGNKKVTYCKVCNHPIRHRSLQRQLAHYYKCVKPNSDKENKSQDKEKIMQDNNSVKTAQCLKAMIENNIPIKAIESESFRQFACNAYRNWRPPSRQELSSVHIPRLSQTLQSKFLSQVSTTGRTHLTIEIDGWEDRNNRSLLGVIATDSIGRKHLLDLRDISLKSHTAAVIVEELMDILKPVPTYAINSIVSDSAANYKKAREDLISKQQFKHVIQHRCLAHLFNLIGSKLTCKSQPICQLLTEANFIATTISSSSYWRAYLKQLKLRKIKHATQVRWYSNVNMLVTLVEAKAAIMENILPNLPDDKKAIVSIFDWVYLDEVLEVLKPINHCIGRLETKNICLGEAIHEILKYGRELFNLTPSETVKAARKAFLSYFNVKKIGRVEFSLYIAAYVLDPRFKLAYVTDEGIGLAFEAITRIAVKSGVALQTVKSCLAEDFEIYKQNMHNEIGQVQPGSWWENKMIGAMLGPVGVRFAHLRASSANIERTFSTVKYIQSGSRLNFLPSTVVDMARLKISYQEENFIEDDEVLFQLSSNGDQSHLSSLESQDSQSQENFSNLTLEHGQSWIEEEDNETKFDYQNFFLYFDFKILETQPNLVSNASCSITEDQIRECVDFARTKISKVRERIDIQPEQSQVILESELETEAIYTDLTAIDDLPQV